MVQRNDHHQQSPRYRASSLPIIGEDDVNSGRNSTQALRRRRVTPTPQAQVACREVMRSRAMRGSANEIRESRHIRQAHTTFKHDLF